MTAEEIFDAIDKYLALKQEENLKELEESLKSQRESLRAQERTLRAQVENFRETQKALPEEEEAYFSSQEFQDWLNQKIVDEESRKQYYFHFSKEQRKQVELETIIRSIKEGVLPQMDKTFMEDYFKDLLAERVPDKKENKQLYKKVRKDQKKLNKQRKKKNEEADNAENEVINTENDLEDWLNKQVDAEEDKARKSIHFSEEKRKEEEQSWTSHLRETRKEELNKKLNDINKQIEGIDKQIEDIDKQIENIPKTQKPPSLSPKIIKSVKFVFGKQDQENLGYSIDKDYETPEQSGFYVAHSVSSTLPDEDILQHFKGHYGYSNKEFLECFNNCYDILKDISNGQEKWTFIAPQSEEEVISILKQYDTQPQAKTENSEQQEDQSQMKASDKIKNENLNEEHWEKIQNSLTEQFETQYSDEEKAALVIYKSRMFNLIGRLWQMSPKVEDINMDHLKQQLSSSESEISKISKSLISFFNKAKENPENQEFFEKYMSALDFSRPEKLVETTLQQMAILENVGRKIKAPEDITLFRGVNNPKEWKNKPLDKLSQARFISSSPHYGQAKKFLGTDNTDNNTLFRLRIQKGTPIIPMFFSVKKTFNCPCKDSPYADYSDLPSNAITIGVSHQNIQTEIVLDSQYISYDLANEQSVSLPKQTFNQTNTQNFFTVTTGVHNSEDTSTFYPQVEVFAKELAQQKEDENLDEEESSQESNDEESFDPTSTPLDNIDTNKKNNDKNDEDDNDDEDEPGSDC